MHHFLFEFITGGGLTGQTIPKTLIKEGEIMVQTLCSELIEAGYANISLTHDNIKKVINEQLNVHVIQRSLTDELPEFIKTSDVSWLIAPETGDCLASLAELFIEHGNLFIGSNPDAIRIATSKLATNKILAEANINVVETRPLSEAIPVSDVGWIVKPDDGAGGEGCYFIKDENKLSVIRDSDKNSKLLIQPYRQGKSMSMSLLVFDDDVRLLACNKQYVDIKDETVSLTAIGVNECLMYKDQMMSLAKKIVEKISGFAGYVGVDMVESNNELFVLDINPRLTTAYAGLSESLGCNVTTKILNTFLNKNLPDIDLSQAVPVRVNI
jgi:tyramine---L-glutamate ligase